MAKKNMRTKIGNFANDAPLLSLFYLAVVGFTAVDVMSSFTLPRGKGPFSPKSNLGASTSTSTTTSSSHPPIVRESMQEHAGGGLSGLHGAGMGHCNCASPSCPSCRKGMGFHHEAGENDSRQLPPGLRRRLMSRTFESEVSGAHLGKQELSVKDRANDHATKSFSAMYGLSGITPESEGGWTE